MSFGQQQARTSKGPYFEYAKKRWETDDAFRCACWTALHKQQSSLSSGLTGPYWALQGQRCYSPSPLGQPPVSCDLLEGQTRPQNLLGCGLGCSVPLTALLLKSAVTFVLHLC